MRKILYAIHFNHGGDTALYMNAFKERGWTVVTAASEQLLLRADAVLLYADEYLLTEEEKQFLTTASQRRIPVAVIHYPLLDEEVKGILETAEVIRCDEISFEQLDTLIRERQQDIYVRKEEPVKSPVWINALFLIVSAFLLCFILWKLYDISRDRAVHEQSETEVLEEKVRQAVVKVYSLSSFGTEAWRGSGFAVSTEGYIVTNAHVVEHASVSYRVVYREQTYDAEVVSVSETQDIALIKVNQPLRNILVFEEEKPQEGETVWALGYPGDQKLTMLEGTYNGVQAVYAGGLTYTGITMPLRQGISGSPVVNAKGKVVGIASAVSLTDENKAWMVDSATALQFLKDWLFLQK
ncbi:MAG: trypsin-like peptidase domain-containing protein [Solobacterium sp.]|nr:trypsin-like peptidase domain-containing protein [Solobacterium sp.]